MASGKATDNIQGENEQETPVTANAFSNDGSFLQIYKQKLQEMELEKKRKEEKAKKKNEIQLKRLNNQLQVETVAIKLLTLLLQSLIYMDSYHPLILCRYTLCII